MVAISAAEEKSRNGVSGVSVIPASPGFDALFITETPFFRAAPVIAWLIEPDTDPLAISTEGSDYNALRYPDGRVYAIEHFFPNTGEWIKWLKI